MGANKKNVFTIDDHQKIEDGLKKHFSVTNDPQNKVFLTSDGKWIQLKDGDEHFSVLSGVTTKYVDKDKARKAPLNQYFAGGLVRAGFDKSVTYVNGNKPLTSNQLDILSTTMIKKGYTSDKLIVEFPNADYEKKIVNLIKKNIGESYKKQQSINK
ncbi:MAG TPA: hypothetical protein VLE21_04800 [Candidatus Nitrosocosmicus sp.]|nr:hypothetical protein [Candidatus Nitrosocosmicus sp.]